MFRFEKIFCIEYNLTEGCSNCNFNLNSTNYLKPYINVNEPDLLDKISIETIINRNLTNELTQCSICGYQNGKVVNENNPNFFRIINNKKYPQFMFIAFDLLNELDQGSDEQLRHIEYNRRIQYNSIICDYMTDNLEISGLRYNLKAVICTPKYNHFTVMLIDLKEDIFSLKKNNDYFYDGISKNHDILLIKNKTLKLSKENPYIALYQKINS